MYWILGKPRNVADLKAINFINVQSNPRDRLPILVIDDQPFPYKSLLQQHHFNITQVEDVSDVRSVEAYPIILCDIRGVGKKFQSKYEGAHLIAEIKQFYPQKYLIAYTAQTYDPNYNKYLDLADHLCVKDLEQEEWVERLDQAIVTVINPTFLWKRLRERLLDMDIPLVELVHLEDQFVGYIQQKVKVFPSKELSSHFPDNVKPLIESVGHTVRLLTGK